ncbi:MAG: hypothetical protein ABI253_17015, partial [Mycobacterium sp.]
GEIFSTVGAQASNRPRQERLSQFIIGFRHILRRRGYTVLLPVRTGHTAWKAIIFRVSYLILQA